MVLTFSMQGWGNFINTGVLIIQVYKPRHNSHKYPYPPKL